jgi:cytosine/adenosine deaminase-related metal-dependent hydrolase
VQHLHGWLPGGLEPVEAGAGEVIRAYQDIGMRVSYAFAFRDRIRLVYRDDNEFTATRPAELRPVLQRHFARFGPNLADYGPLFEHLRATHYVKERVKIQLAPANLRWCSDAALDMLGDLSARYEAPMHIHLVETPYQKEYARRRGGGSALDYTALVFSGRA